MAKASDNPFPSVLLVEQAAAPATPAAGQARLYRGTDNKLYIVDDGGVAAEVGGTSAVYAQAYRSAALTVATGTVTMIPWDAEDFDASGFHSLASNLERFTVPAGLGGTYRVAAQVSWQGAVTGGGKELSIGLYKNGLTYAWSSFPMTTEPTSTQLEVLISLAAGDYIDLRAYHNSGSGVALFVTADRRYCRMSIERVA